LDTSHDFAVHDFTVRETPTLTTGGKTALTTVVTYSVGSHGPFTLVYQGGRPNGAQITEDITAKVRELQEVASALHALNSQQQR
jgi:hypothetical protein